MLDRVVAGEVPRKHHIALRDAALLSGNLKKAGLGLCTIEEAINDYERQMREYGFAAVRASLQVSPELVTTRSDAAINAGMALLKPNARTRGWRRATARSLRSSLALRPATASTCTPAWTILPTSRKKRPSRPRPE